MAPPPPTDVRKLFKQQQTQRQQQKKIEHTFAKYDSQGRLGCVLCNTLVKGEQLWNPHLQSTRHKELLAKLKAIKQKQQQEEGTVRQPRKRPISEQDSSSTRGGGDAALLSKRARFEQIEKEMEEEDEEHEEEQQEKEEDDLDSMEDEDQDQDMEQRNELPADFFDTPAKPTEKTVAPVTTTATMKVGIHRDLPSGFFDDANEEAKARQVAAPDVLEDQRLEEDYAAFKEMMVDTNEETDKMQEQDEETILLDREVTLARQQLALDQRIQHLKQLRQQPRQQLLQQRRQSETTTNEQPEDINAFDDSDRVWKKSMKSSVRQVMTQHAKKTAQPVFDDEMEDIEEEEEEEEEEEDDDEKEEDWDWRAQRV